MLNTTPPRKADPSAPPLACCKSGTKARPSLPALPMVSPRTSDVRTSPIA